MADTSQASPNNSIIPPPPGGAMGWPQTDTGQPDKYEYGAGTGVQRLVNRLTGGGLPGVEQAIQEEHTRRLNDMNNFRSQMATLSQQMTSGKDAQGRPLYDVNAPRNADGTLPLTPEGLALQHAYEAAQKNYLERAKISSNAKSIAEKTFDFAKNIIHHHVAGGGGAQPAAGATTAAPTIAPPPAGGTAPAPAAAPAAAAAPAPVVPPPPSGASKVGQNPTPASASSGAAPKPAASAPATLPAPPSASASAPAASAPAAASSTPAATPAPAASTTAPATAPALPPPPQQGAIPPLMSAMGAPQMQAELTARNAAEADAAKMRAEIGVREKIYNDYRETHKGATPMEAMEYTRAVLGGQFPASLMRETPETVIDPAHPGQPIPAYRSAMDGQYYVPGTNTPIPGAMKWTPAIGQGRQVWGKDKDGFYSYLADKGTNQPIPGTENRTTLPPAGMLDKIKQGHHYYVDDQNQIHDLPETTVTGPAVPTSSKGTGTALPPPPKHGTAKGTAAAPPATAPATGGNEGRVIGNKGPTGATRSRADAAEAIVPLIESAKAQLADPEVASKLGVLPGRLSEFERRLGDMDPKVAKLYGTLKSIYSLGGTLHGWRSIKVAEEFEKAYGGLHTNPKALAAGLDAMAETAHDVYKAGYHHDIGENVLPPPPSKAGSADDEIMQLVKKAKGGK